MAKGAWHKVQGARCKSQYGALMQVQCFKVGVVLKGQYGISTIVQQQLELEQFSQVNPEPITSYLVQ